MNNLFHRKQLFQLISASFYELIREPGVIFWGIVFPILMSLGLGVAFMNKGVVIRKVGIIETTYDSSTKLKGFLNRYTVISKQRNEQDPYYKYTVTNDKLGNTTFLFRKTNWNDAMVALKRGKFNVIVQEKNNKLSYFFDPLNTDAQATYIRLTGLLNKENPVLKESDKDIQPLTLRGTRYIDFLIPGLIAMGIMMSSMWGISYSIIEKRTKKLLRRMVSTPMKKSYFLIATTTVRMAMNLTEASVIFLFAYLVFNIRIQGSVPALITTFIAGNIAFAGIAIFISSHTSKTETGNGLINAVVMPMMVLSGVFFSYHNFPDWSIPVLQKLPLTMMADDMRSIFIEGAGFAATGLHTIVLVIIGVVFFGVGIKIFKWY